MLRIETHKIIVTALMLLCFSIGSRAQYSSEADLKTAANEMFENEKYVDALPLFSQLLSLYPKDISYNYKYGTCILFGSRDKEKALQYLKFGTSKSNVDPIAFYFLAKAYHHNYQFAPAIVNYNKFKGKTGTTEHRKYQIGREIKMCQNGQQLLKSMTDIGVLSKKEIKSTDFFRSYNLKGIGGKIIVKPDDFKTKLDKKNNDKSVIYLGEKKDMVVYASYGKGGSTGKDIYRVVKLPDGQWSKPVILSDVINSEFDEDFPFLHPDGRTLYFCSKGFNSMGGYDIFKSTLDLSTGKWSYPKNMDFPINTPDDDILYISDIDNKLAYFASSRASKQGELTVYRVKVDPEPTENSVIKGFFLAESNPTMKNATITVMDAEKDRRYGVYKTDNTNGEYLLVFPSNGGKFKILVETSENAPVHSATIELPVLDGFRALKQELLLVGEGDAEKLVVKNLFDETDEFDLNDPLFVENILKKKARLDVNTTEAEINNALANSLNNALDNNEEPKSSYSDLTNEQIVNKSDGTASKIMEQTKISKIQANTSYQIANEKSKKAKLLYAESEKLLVEAESAESESAKSEKLALAQKKKFEAAKLINETIAALAIAKTLDNEIIERESDITKVQSLKENINLDIDNGNRKEAEMKLADLDKIASATYHNESALETEKEITKSMVSEKQKIYKKDRDNVTELLNREYELTETVNKLEAKKATTKKKSDKENIDISIKALQIDIEDTKYDLTNARSKAAISETAYNDAKNKAATTNSIITSVNEGNEPGSALNETGKLQIENDIMYFEKEGLVGLYPEDIELTEPLTSGESYSLEEHKDEFEIVDESGKIIDYNTSYSVKLAEVDNNSNPLERAEGIVDVNTNWVESIEEEIDIRKNQLKVETNAGTKTDLENKITSLEVLKNEKQKEINENNELIAENKTPTTNLNVNTNEENTNEVKEEVNIMNTDGSIIDYEDKYTQELNELTGEDNFDSYTKKSGIHANWANATEQEILIKKMELIEASTTEKDGIENELAILENNLLEQQEFVALYDIQAESMRTSEPLANNEEPITNNEEPVTNNEEPENNETEYKYEEKFTAELDEVTGEDSFETFNKKANIHTNWANATEREIETKKETLTGVSGEEKNTLENEIAVLESNLLEQQEFAALYTSQAESMKSEEPLANNEEPVTNNEEPVTNNEEPITNNEEPGVNEIASELVEENLTVNNLDGPEDDFSNLKYNNSFNYKSGTSKKAILPVVSLKNEARILNDEAEIKLNNAGSASSQEEKDNLIAEAEELTNKSNKKQEEIAGIYETANRNEYYNNQVVLSKLNSENKDPGSNNTIMTELLVEEADNYYEEAKQKREDAVNASNTTAKEVALQKAYELEMKAIEKQKMAINNLYDGSTQELYATVNELPETNNEEPLTNNEEPVTNNEEPVTNNEEPVTNNEEPITNNEEPLTNAEPPTANNKEITPGDQEHILSLEPSEINEIKDSEEYKNYAELKKSNRRLVKEAQVEYLRSEKSQREADEQKQLGVSLKAMMEGATSPEDKEKKKQQLEKLNTMITKNETEAEASKKIANDKEAEAKDAEDKSNLILLNANENDAKSFTVIEKTETFDSKFMADVMSRSGEPLANNEEPSTNNEEPVTNNEEPVTNNEEPITNNEEPVTNNEEPVTNNEEPITNNEEPITNNEIENIDEIPTVLSKSIFVINNNEAAYNESKKIPVSPKLPEGLVFKVQIGAFRNPIPQNHFKGFAPIMAEDAGNGITRYTAGLFKTFNMANEAKGSIRSIGYSDAFVVAFLNGNRININEARAMLDGSLVDEGNFAINTPNNTQPETNNSIPNDTNTDEVKDGVSIDVRNIDGIFYSVQVGVYSKPVTGQQLGNVSPLNSERTGGGLIRYTSGVYKTLNEANAAKERIRGLGVSDAFIVAYNGGTKITVAEATNLLNSGNSTNQVEDNSVEDNTVKDNTVEDNTIEDNTIEDNTVEDNTVEDNTVEDNTVEDNTIEDNTVEDNTVEDNTVEDNTVEDNTVEDNTVEDNTVNTFKNDVPGYEPKEDLNLEFKVKLGEYVEDVPVEDAGLFLRLTGRGVKNYEEGDKTIYTIGSFPDYESALDLQIEMKEMGVKSPKTIVFKDGLELPLEDAFKLMKDNQ